jgi:ABC-type lipoprotein export system ATPase subunit
MAIVQRHAARSNNGNGHTAPMVIGQNLHKSFQLGDQWVHALRGVSLRIPQGQFIGIMGPSGSGKSTLLYMLGGLDSPSSGEIMVANQRIDGMPGEDLASFRRETIGFIFQAFHLVPTLTALENVALPGIFAAMPRDARERRAFKLLEALGMAERLDHRSSQLSGGQQQRVAIARALFNNPPIIMADEPTGALDSKTGQTVMEMLRYLCTRRGKTIIVVTHDAGVASYADRMLHLRDGEIVEDVLQPPNANNRRFAGSRTVTVTPNPVTALPQAAESNQVVNQDVNHDVDVFETFSHDDDDLA